jgi:hypothetical protein
MSKYIPDKSNCQSFETLVLGTKCLNGSAKLALEAFAAGSLANAESHLRQMRNDLGVLTRQVEGAEWVAVQAGIEASKLKRKAAKS